MNSAEERMTRRKPIARIYRNHQIVTLRSVPLGGAYEGEDDYSLEARHGLALRRSAGVFGAVLEGIVIVKLGGLKGVVRACDSDMEEFLVE